MMNTGIEAPRRLPGADERQRILLVDDDRDRLRVLDHTLKREGFDTVIVAAGSSVLNLIKSLKPDIVILDDVLPGDDSLQVVDHIREQSDVPIIVLTQAYEMEALRRALSHGADDYIRKPFGTRSFVARVRAKLRRAEKKTVRA
jgi:DNA-binding response OmpR family regulator